MTREPRETYVIRNGKLIPKRVAAPLDAAPAPYVISDTMEPLQHHATGRVHTSKSAFRADTRAAGCEEVGNDPAAQRDNYKRPDPSSAEIAVDVKRAIAELRSR